MARKPRTPPERPPVEAPEGHAQPAPLPEPEAPQDPAPKRPRSPRDWALWAWNRLDWSTFSWRGVIVNIAIVFATVFVVLTVFLTALNTPTGRRILIQYATGIKLNSGLRFEVGRIDGSLYGAMTIHDLKVLDPKGVFLQSPVIHLEWRPFGALDRHVDIRDVSSPLIEMLRQPVLNPEQNPPQGGPLLPNLRIDLSHIQLDRIQLDQPVLGQAYNLTLGGDAHIRHGQLTIAANAGSDKGDALKVLLDAVPDKNRLNLDAALNAPKGGIVTALAGLDKPLMARIAGQGAWAFWQGKATAGLGGDSLLDLGLTARDGVFTIKGDTHPAKLISGATSLLQPAVAVEMTATMKNRALDTELKLASHAMAVNADGVVDFAANTFRNVQVHARLLDPAALGKDLTSNDMHADLVVDGVFATPHIAYDVAAKRFAIGSLTLTGLTAKGKSRVASNAVIIPLNAQMASMTGLGDRVDPLLTHVRLDGELTIGHDGRLSTNTLHLSSDRAKASGTIAGDVGGNRYSVKANAAVSNYDVPEFAVLNATSDVAVTLTNGHATVTGMVSGQTTKIHNEGLESFLGGNARISGGYAWSDGAGFSVRNVSGKAPGFTLTSADGAIDPKGGIRLKAVATSAKYGPLDLVASGTLDAPQAVLHAPSPGIGGGIRDVTANLATSADGYLVKASGQSDYGPFNADTLIHQGTPLVIAIRHAEFAGVGASGTLTQTAAGPFAGKLDIAGSGLTGTAELINASGVQGVAVNASGNDINLPGPAQVHAGRAIIAANIVLRDTPQINADVQAADLRYAGFSLATSRAKIAMTGQAGTIQAVAHGRAAYPFDLAVNGTIAPNLYAFAAQGSANGVPLTLNHAARVTKQGNDWVLAPVTIQTGPSQMDVAGRFGATTKVQTRLRGVDVALANAFVPDLGVGGMADGAVDFAQSGDGFPTAHASLKIANFTRSSAAVASAPVDLMLDAQLDPDLQPASNYVHAVVRQGGAVVGRVQADLRPAGSGPWLTRVQNAGLSGGVRYNGSAAVPFSLTGLARQQLTGAVALAADFSGTVSNPRLDGVIKSDSLTYDNEAFGTRITHIAMDGRFTNDRLELTSFSGTAGDGTIKGSGWLSLAAAQHFPMQLHADLNNARLARSDQINSIVSGSIDVTNNPQDGATVSGDLRLPELRYTVIRQAAAEINVLDGVRRKGDETKPQLTADETIPSKWKLNVRVRANRQVFVSGMGLDSEWSVDLRVQGTTADPRVVGEMKVIRGNYTFAGRAFDLDSGTITFDGGPLANPEISLQASAALNDITGIIRIGGTAQHPDIAFSSTPALPQDEVLSRMLFGESVANISATEALQLASAVNGLNGGTDYLNPLGALRSVTGIDRLRVVSADTATGRGTSLAAGKYLTNNVYVEIVTDTKGFTATQIEVALSRALSVLSQVGNTGTSVGIRYSKDY